MKIISELNGIQLLSKFEEHYKGKNILLVTGKKSFSSSGAEMIMNRLLAKENVTKFSDFSTNPKIEDAITGAKIARSKSIDVIISIGGGSVIDIAKLIKAFLKNESIEADLATGKTSLENPNLPHIAIPTTAGSGSEATHFAVVYIGSDKYSLASQYLLPDCVILDGQLVLTGSKYLKSCNVLDAMAQSIESFWAAGSTEVSREFALRAINTGWKIIPEFLQEDCSGETAQKMIEASNLAGKAINISKTTAAHAWSYAFTSQFNIPHGHAVWLTLPTIFQCHFMADEKDITDVRGVSHLNSIMNKLCLALNFDANTDHDDQLKAFLNSIGIESDMKNLGADNQDERRFVSKAVNIERMSNNPVNLTNYISKIFELN